MTRSIEIDKYAIQYDLDSDDVDALEKEYADAGKPLRTFMDYHYAFEIVILKRMSVLVDKANKLMEVDEKERQLRDDLFEEVTADIYEDENDAD